MNGKILGVIFALVAMLSWGLGDFLIQKVSRTLGIWKCIFFISVTGIIVLIPFVWKNIPQLAHGHEFVFFGLAAFAMLVASVFDFEALKQGKLSVMEPIVATELPLAALLAVALWHESLSLVGWLLIIVIFLGTVLAVTEHHTQLHYHKRLLEKGVIFALTAALCMALLDVIMGISSQVTAPLLTVWVVWIFTGIVSFSYLAYQGKLREIGRDIKKYPAIILGVGILDTLGWVGYCLATSHISIAITTAIGESYVIITIVLGILVNREKLKQHQKWGIALAVIAVIVLAVLVG